MSDPQDHNPEISPDQAPDSANHKPSATQPATDDNDTGIAEMEHGSGRHAKDNTQHNNETENSLYNPTNDSTSKDIFAKLKGSFTQSSNKKAWYAGFGLAGILGILTIGSIFSFINVFKLSHFIENIETKAMVRYTASIDHRSSKWVEAYVKIRLTSLSPDGSDSDMFRANKVDTNNPLSDWYKTMRTSNFERDLAKKGIVFTSYTNGAERGFAVLSVDNKVVAAGIQDKSVKTPDDLNKFIEKKGGIIDIAQNFDLDKPGNNKEARRAVKKIVNEQTHFYNVIKRRQIRKSIQNMTGIRDWRFFEKTQEKYEAKKSDIRKKIVTSVLPESTKSGKLLGCLLGYNDCSNASSDPADPKNQASGTPEGAPKENDTKVTEEPDPNAPKDPPKAVANTTKDVTEQALKETTEGAVNEAFGATLKTIIGKANMASSIASFMDTISKVNAAMKNGSLSKIVYTAKLAGAMGVSQRLLTIKDQLKTGELTATEFGSVNRELADIGNNDGWRTVISNPDRAGTAKAESNKIEIAKDKEKYCSAEYQEILNNTDSAKEANKGEAFLCDIDKPNGGGTVAAGIESAWKKDIAPLVDPIDTVYKSMGLNIINGWISSATSWATDWAVNGIMRAFGGTIETFMSAIMSKVTTVLGAAPAVNMLTPAGKIGAIAITGFAGIQSVTQRESGAAASNPQSKAATTKLVLNYELDKKTRQSIYEKYLDTSNPQSIASIGLYDTATVLSGQNITQVLSGYASNIGNSITKPFSLSANAASDPYAIDGYGGVNSYDYSSQCMDINPENATPQNSTNIISVLGSERVKESELTWDLVTNKEAWYEFIYAKVDPNTKDISGTTEKIYNCQLLENHVRGGIGYIYGYNKDGGLDTSSNGNIGTTEISLATYNIRNANSSQGDPVKNEKPWSVRAAAVTAAIQANYAEIWGFQEVWTNAQIEALQASLNGAYDHTVSAKDANDAAIFYDNSKYRPIDTKSQGEFELKFYNKHKYCAWIGLERVIDNQKFYVYDCHLTPGDGKGPNDSRLEQLRQIVDHMKKTNTESYPVILMGDFNLNNNDSPSEGKNDTKHVKFLEDSGFKDTYDMTDAGNRKNGNCNTFNDFDSTFCKKDANSRGSQLDRIYVNPGGLPFVATSHKVVIDKYNGIWPTDHNSVQAVLSLSSRGSGTTFSGATVNADGWVWPLKSVTLGGCFYEDYGGYRHAGIDFRASTGTDIFAIADGTIDGFDAKWGMIRIKHNTPDGVVYSIYEHMLNEKFTKLKGATVKAGEKIGESGNTAPPGGSKGPHLHLTLTKDPGKWDRSAFGTNTLINPLKYLNGNKDWTISGTCSATPESK